MERVARITSRIMQLSLAFAAGAGLQSDSPHLNLFVWSPVLICIGAFVKMVASKQRVVKAANYIVQLSMAFFVGVGLQSNYPNLNLFIWGFIPIGIGAIVKTFTGFFTEEA